MKIGIIGAGNLGNAIGRRLAAKGHAVAVSFARTPDKVAAAAAGIGGGARAMSVADAVAFADVVVLASPWSATEAALREAGHPAVQPALRKVLWDCTNALKPDLSGLAIGTTTSAGEEVAKRAPWAKVVKAVPPFAEVLATPGELRVGGRAPGVFVCGDDAPARATVAALVRDLGADPTDAGPLVNARYTEPAGFLLVQLAYALGHGGRVGLAFLEDPKTA